MKQKHERRIIDHLIGNDNQPPIKITNQRHPTDNQALQSNFRQTFHPDSSSIFQIHSEFTKHSQDYEPASPFKQIILPLKQLPQNHQKIQPNTIKNNQTNNQTNNFSSKVVQRQSVHQKFQKSVSYQLQICIDIGNGCFGTIYVNQASDPKSTAELFCQNYKLDKYIAQIITQQIIKQMKNQQQTIMKEIKKYELTHKTNRSVTQLSQQKQSSKSIKNHLKNDSLSQKYFGADKILRKNKTKDNSRKSSLSNLSQPMLGPGDPYKTSINQISEEIINKIGKDAIIMKKTNKSKEKIQRLKEQNQQNINKQMQQCVFKPKINKISTQINKIVQKSGNKIENTESKKNIRQCSSRYQNLYLDWKNQEYKKQLLRKNSFQSISFKPQINYISKQIIQKIKSAQDNQCNNNFENTFVYKNKMVEANIKSGNCDNHDNVVSGSKNYKLEERNSNNLPVGQYLYSQAIKLQKKRQKSCQILPNCETIILNRSEKIVNDARNNKIRQIFRSLSKDGILKYDQIDRNNLSNVQLLFTPVFDEMKSIDVCLCEQQFLQAGKRMLKYLSPQQKNMLLNYNKITSVTQQRKYSMVNKKSLDILKNNHNYKDYDVYMRGIIHQRQIKQQVQKNRQKKVRQELSSCTFQPYCNSKIKKYKQ